MFKLKSTGGQQGKWQRGQRVRFGQTEQAASGEAEGEAGVVDGCGEGRQGEWRTAGKTCWANSDWEQHRLWCGNSKGLSITSAVKKGNRSERKKEGGGEEERRKKKKKKMASAVGSNAAVPFWRAAGMTYITYSNICASLVRSCLKEPHKAEAMDREKVHFAVSKWAEGKPQKPSTNNLSLSVSSISFRSILLSFQI